jgi:hypothetical protein
VKNIGNSVLQTAITGFTNPEFLKKSGYLLSVFRITKPWAALGCTFYYD